MKPKFLKEFKEFSIKGNVFDMAIGIIIGTAFSKVVTSLVNDLLMPPLGFLISRVNFESLSVVLQEMSVDSSGNVLRELVTLNYGNFLQVLIDFLIIAISIFLVIKMFNRLRNRAQNPEDVSTPTPKEIELLSDIKELLKKQQEGQAHITDQPSTERE